MNEMNKRTEFLENTSKFSYQILSHQYITKNVCNILHSQHLFLQLLKQIQSDKEHAKTYSCNDNFLKLQLYSQKNAQTVKSTNVTLNSNGANYCKFGTFERTTLKQQQDETKDDESQQLQDKTSLTSALSLLTPPVSSTFKSSCDDYSPVPSVLSTSPLPSSSISNTPTLTSVKNTSFTIENLLKNSKCNSEVKDNSVNNEDNIHQRSTICNGSMLPTTSSLIFPNVTKVSSSNTNNNFNFKVNQLKLTNPPLSQLINLADISFSNVSTTPITLYSSINQLNTTFPVTYSNGVTTNNKNVSTILNLSAKTAFHATGLYNNRVTSSQDCPLLALYSLTNQTLPNQVILGRSPHYELKPSSTIRHSTSVQRKRTKSRTAFSNFQLEELEKRFALKRYLTSNDRDHIALSLGLTNSQVITWFQNRRAKLKRDVEEWKADVAAAQKTFSSSTLSSTLP